MSFGTLSLRRHPAGPGKELRFPVGPNTLKVNRQFLFEKLDPYASEHSILSFIGGHVHHFDLQLDYHDDYEEVLESLNEVDAFLKAYNRIYPETQSVSEVDVKIGALVFSCYITRTVYSPNRFGHDFSVQALQLKIELVGPIGPPNMIAAGPLLASMAASDAMPVLPALAGAAGLEALLGLSIVLGIGIGAGIVLIGGAALYQNYQESKTAVPGFTPVPVPATSTTSTPTSNLNLNQVRNSNVKGTGTDSSNQSEKEMLGKNGVKVTSKTVWKGKGKERIDVENPNPGKRPGQIHHQDNEGNKYLYDPKTDSFRGAPNKVNDLLKRPDFRNGIKKGMKYLGEQ